MRRKRLKLSLHLVVLLCTTAAILIHGKLVLWRPGVFCHPYSVFYLGLLLLPLLLWRITRWQHWLHVPSLVILLIVLRVTCSLTPVMDYQGETLASFDARVGAVQPGWTRTQVLERCGEPFPFDEEPPGPSEVWFYKWHGTTRETDSSAWGVGCKYRITFDAQGRVSDITRREYEWDVIAVRIAPPPWWPIVAWGSIVLGGLALAALTALCLCDTRHKA